VKDNGADAAPGLGTQVVYRNRPFTHLQWDDIRKAVKQRNRLISYKQSGLVLDLATDSLLDLLLAPPTTPPYPSNFDSDPCSEEVTS
jgi:hypothetical protein